MSKPTTPAVALFGYNNTRIYDVEKIKELVQNRLSAVLILIKQGITNEDFAVTPYCIDANPEDKDLAQVIAAYTKKESLNLISCLPFSDKGVVGAAFAAKSLGLFHDNSETAEAMLDKNKFRELEKSFGVSSDDYKKPFFSKAFSSTELFANLEKLGTFFIKPSSEGNSRGCMKIENKDDLLLWLETNAQYLSKGVMCEEYLSSGHEYSFDGLNSNYWITEKYTTSGSYRAEYQHIVPAPLSNALTEKIKGTLTPLLTHLGSNGGAFHHEFFLLDKNQVASVEPNRRPAGMWLWDLAQWSFENFNAWEHWIDVCSGKNPLALPLKQLYFSGVRGVIPNKSGRIKYIDVNQIELEFRKYFEGEKFKFMIFKKPGDFITTEVKDNSDFIAFVATRDSKYLPLIKKLKLAEDIILKHTLVEGLE